MKRNLLLTLILVALAAFFTTNLYGQTTKYTGGTIEYSVNGKTKPIGKNVTVTFDSFFKSYVVTYTDINGYKNKLTFEYENASRYSCNGVLYDCILC
jgi:opacity protein-like surface antigen